ncbi:hypothetical protein MLD38_027613 [Melastoma candidum]|uniref:Uncharacterized protein n=1 Tax=Melastoma candidum TaxID=119954 RepID=A0ACB9P3L8_9MYRT|nr:hypothetical protein MLD38_027613 [Melastoma candidum]
MFPFWNHNSGDYVDMAATFASDAVPDHGAGHGASIEGVQFTPTTMCPKNFIVFDQSSLQSRVMFHPSMAPKVGNPFLQPSPAIYGENVKMTDAISGRREMSFSYEEDSADIDALLGSEIEGDGGEENYDEDELSTARTNANYECYTPDSGSSAYASKPVELDDSSLLQMASAGWGSRSAGEAKEEKIQEMVKVLRGIVPGGNRMSTATLLDESVRYLKLMKMEAAKLGDFPG